jgi:surface antigen
MAAAPVVLSGCFGAGQDYLTSAATDSSINTRSISDVHAKTVNSDETTVSNAVTSADLGKLGNDPLPWANTATGSSGVVTSIAEQMAEGMTCRQFTTTRHSYSGIAKFSGLACLGSEGNWNVLRFEQL